MTTYTDRQNEESLEQECPNCGALCLVDDGNYAAIESIPVTVHESTSPIPGEPDGGAGDVRGEVIYQVAFSDDDGGWNDASKHIYDSPPQHMRRIVYAAPSQPAAPAEPIDEDTSCTKQLNALGDDEGQGLDSFWKGAFREGWKARAKLAAPSTAAHAGATLDDFRDQSIIDWISCLKADSGCKQAALEHLEELYQRLSAFTNGGDKPVAYVSSVGATRIVLLNGAKLNDFDELYTRPVAPTPVADSGATQIDVAVALEQQRALQIVAAVRQNGFAKADGAIPTQAESVFDLACEEIEHRLRTEVWELNGIASPIAAAKPVSVDAYAVKDEIIAAVRAYGDARADNGDSGEAITNVIRLVRGALAASMAVSVNAARATDEPPNWRTDVAKWLRGEAGRHMASMRVGKGAPLDSHALHLRMWADLIELTPPTESTGSTGEPT